MDRRKDRDPLIGMWEVDPESGKEFMVGMVRIKVFGPPCELSDSSASDFMKVLAQKYTNGHVRQEDLYAIRDAELARLGLKVVAYSIQSVFKACVCLKLIQTCLSCWRTGEAHPHFGRPGSTHSN